jgi:hypothetical protein
METILKRDEGVQSMARLNAILTDWYNNIDQIKRGVRSCERLEKFREEGLYQTANRYFEHIASENDMQFNGEARELLNEWSDEFRPDYVSESEEKDWDKFDRSLTRVLLDGEIRIGGFAVDTAIDICNVTINIYDTDILREELKEEFENLWIDWFHRLNDLYWERRGQMYQRIVKQIENGYVESEDELWETHKDRYPEFPRYTVIADEEIY